MKLSLRVTAKISENLSYQHMFDQIRSANASKTIAGRGKRSADEKGNGDLILLTNFFYFDY